MMKGGHHLADSAGPGIVLGGFSLGRSVQNTMTRSASSVQSPSSSMDPRCTPSITSSGPSPRAFEHDPQVAAAP
jgi:hypothetical protein